MKAFIGLFAMALALPAYAEAPQCAPYDAVATGLANGWQEERQSRGVANDGTFELFANVNTGSWSLIVIRPDGIACLVASGGEYSATPTIPGSDA